MGPIHGGVPLVERKLYVFGTIRVDTRNFPLIVMEIGKGRCPDSDYVKALGVCEAALRSGQKSFQITDLSALDEAPPSQRKLAGEWTERTAPLQQQWSLGGAVVAPSAFLRGVLTAVHWLKKPPAPTRVCASRDEAVVHAVSVLEAAGLPIPPELRMQASISKISPRPGS